MKPPRRQRDNASLLSLQKRRPRLLLRLPKRIVSPKKQRKLNAPVSRQRQLLRRKDSRLRKLNVLLPRLLHWPRKSVLKPKRLRESPKKRLKRPRKRGSKLKKQNVSLPRLLHWLRKNVSRLRRPNALQRKLRKPPRRND